MNVINLNIVKKIAYFTEVLIFGAMLFFVFALQYDWISLNKEYHCKIVSGLIMLGFFIIVTLTKILFKVFHSKSCIKCCSYCGKVFHNGRWITLEEYLKTEENKLVSHSICDVCKNIYSKQLF